MVVYGDASMHAIYLVLLLVVYLQDKSTIAVLPLVYWVSCPGALFKSTQL